MPAFVVIGGQWGDEGKGRIVDLLARKATVVCRYSAGHNAGHTIKNNRGTFKLHLVPAGILHPGKSCVIGNGVVVDPQALLQEIESLESRGVSTKGLYVSDRSHVIMPWHRLQDVLDEKMRGGAAIGTTGKGVGPAFVDKVARSGLRMADLIDPEAFLERLSFLLEQKNRLLERYYGEPPLDLDALYQEYREYGTRLRPYVEDTGARIQTALDRGENVLLEGAQGSLLDLDHGTYDYVTSSVPSSTSGGASLGVGIGVTQITRVVGVYKAYNTRVGNGPFPTELTDETGDRLREAGGEGHQEYGTTTGRARRCGWFDSVAARYTVRLNGLSAVALTRLDALDDFESIKIATLYEFDGRIIDTLPASARTLDRCKPVYEELPGWKSVTSHIRRFDDLPHEAQLYIKRVEELIHCPVDLISVGPERDQAIVVNPIL